MHHRIAVVTGAGRGIGRAVAEALWRDGYTVVLASRTLAPLEALVTQAHGEGHRAEAVQVDVRDPDSVEALFAHVQARHGRLDVLFNNAGVGAPAVPIDELTIDQWRTAVATNLDGVFFCARAAYALMKTQTPRGGRIINNGSIAAYTPRPFSAPYTASKHAVLGLTKAIALDGRAHDIACSQIDIGNADTEMAERMAQGILQAHGGIAVEPLLDLRHVCDAVLYIANLPLTANVLTMNVMATKMPFVGRG